MPWSVCSRLLKHGRVPADRGDGRNLLYQPFTHLVLLRAHPKVAYYILNF